MPINGLVVMTPTSIASTGTGNSSSIGANGKVTFSSCATLSLNGVFTSSYDNYMVVMRGTTTVANDLGARLRLSGTDATTNYTRQLIYADGTTVAAQRTTSETTFRIGGFDGARRAGNTCYLFGPALAQATATRSCSAMDYLSAYLADYACTHSTATAYDGITFIPNAGAITGEVTVYGFNQ